MPFSLCIRPGASDAHIIQECYKERIFSRCILLIQHEHILPFKLEAVTKFLNASLVAWVAMDEALRLTSGKTFSRKGIVEGIIETVNKKAEWFLGSQDKSLILASQAGLSLSKLSPCHR